MDSAPVSLILLLACILAVLSVELAGSWLNADPLIIIACMRLLDIFIVLGIVYFSNKGFTVVGLRSETAVSGIIQGILWSAGFGAAVLVIAGVLFFADINPVSLIRVQLPNQPERLFLFFIVGGVIAPIAEEIFYRGLIYGFLRKWGVFIALIGSTALFVLSHQITSGPPIPQIVGGILFAMAYETSESLFSPIIIHVLGNLALFSLGMMNQWMMAT